MEKSPKVKIVKITLERHIPLMEKTSRQCGERFLGSKTKEYCSRACVRKAAYWRHPDTYRQKRLESYHRQQAQAKKN